MMRVRLKKKKIKKKLKKKRNVMTVEGMGMEGACTADAC
jgi:hypothetical protein